MNTKNKFMTQKDYRLMLEKLMKPLEKEIRWNEMSGLDLGSSGAVYDKKRSNMEAFIRPLWGMSPYWMLNTENDLKEIYKKKIIQGTDPTNSNYWGDIEDYDQYIVEMPAICLMLLQHKEMWLNEVEEEERQKIFSWLKQALNKKIPKNNWTFFKILIRMTLFLLEEELDRKSLEEELNLIDSMYVGEGWYFDGKESQKDYYVAFAWHYYGLIYAVFMKQKDPKRSEIFIKRATLFAQDYRYYFDHTGSAIPFGRSLTYRFAQGAFFSALIYAEVEAIPWGEMKWLLSQHMKHWFRQPILNRLDHLSIGYYYENLVMAEGYNSSGSPYWSFKLFLLLATKETHPFWQAIPRPIQSKSLHLIKNGDMLIVQEQNGKHVLGYPAGGFINNQAHAAAKYSKFVYSTQFGFSVPKSNGTYAEGAFDNALAISLDGIHYCSKESSDSYYLSETVIFHNWSLYKEIKIKTEIYPFGQWHLRVHEIETPFTLEVREGGFSIPCDEIVIQEIPEEMALHLQNNQLKTSLVGISGYDLVDKIQLEPNTSLFFPRTMMPYLSAKLKPGTHQLIAIVGGHYMTKEGVE